MRTILMRNLSILRIPALIASLLLPASCGEDTGITGSDGNDLMKTGVQAALFDEHDPRFPRLHFLPPMVRMTDFEGDFDATQLDRLIVEICRGHGTTCPAAPLAAFTATSEIAQVRLAGDHYHLNWQVRGPDFTPGDYRINIRAAGLMLGGMNLRLAARPQDLQRLPEEIVGVHIGRTLPVKFRIERVNQVIVVVSVTVDPATSVVLLGGMQQFTATVMGSNGLPLVDRVVTWTSSDEAIATVNGSGVATGHVVGTATITATADGVSGSASIEVAAPDLQVAAVTVPSSVAVGGTLDVAADVNNAGTADAGTTNVRFRVLAKSDGAEIAVVTKPQDALAAGANASVAASFTADAAWPDEVVVEVTTDAGASIPESNETNNTTTSGTITITRPDLRITSVTVPATVPVGGTLAADAVIANAGGAQAAATDVRFRVLSAADGTELATTTNPQAAIDAGATATASASFTAAAAWPRTVVVEVMTDVGAKVPESDETNNTMRSGDVTLTIPDLKVTTVTVPASVPVGGTLTAEASITNAGSADAPATDVRFRVLSVADGTEIAVSVLPQDAIATGASATVSATFTSALAWPREVLVEVTTDAGATVLESDEANNTAKSAKVTITIADLRVAGVTVPAALPAGGNLEVQATIANAGTADAAATDVRFRVLAVSDGAELATKTQPQGAVTAGASLAVSASFTTERSWPRSIVVEVTTDAGATIAESDETNNTAKSVPVSLTDPDLQITSVQFSANVVGLRCSLGITAVVRNAGSGDAGATNLRFTLRNESGVAFAQVTVAQPAITAGASVSVNGSFVSGSDWPGQISGLAEADLSNSVPESDETNNTALTTVTVETRTTVPAGFNKMWVCGTTTSWTDANNWEPAGTPLPAHNVYIPAGISLYPKLAAAQTVNDLTIEDGARVDVAINNLTATGNVVSGSMIGSGSLLMTATASTLRGTVPGLEIIGSVSLSGLANATSVLLSANRTLTLSGHAMSVANFFIVNQNGGTFKHIIMTTASDRLDVGGQMTVQGENAFDAGTLVLRGHFTQAFRSHAVRINPGATRVSFEGTGVQNVTFADATNSFFGDVDIRTDAAGRTNLSTNVRVSGQLVVAAGSRITQSAGEAFYTARMPMEMAPQGYQVSNSTVDGAVILTQDVSLAWPSAGVTINANRTLDLKGLTLAIGGRFTVNQNGGTFRHLLMTTGDDRLEVGNTMIVQGENDLTAGTIVLRGNFMQSFRSHAFRPAGTKFVFDGPAGQDVQFARRDALIL